MTTQRKSGKPPSRQNSCLRERKHILSKVCGGRTKTIGRPSGSDFAPVFTCTAISRQSLGVDILSSFPRFYFLSRHQASLANLGVVITAISDIHAALLHRRKALPPLYEGIMPDESKWSVAPARSSPVARIIHSRTILLHVRSFNPNPASLRP
jgi:hypothetical protein